MEQNRRIRHLQGVSVRNLSLSPAPFRSNKSQTDDNVDYGSTSAPSLLEHRKVKSLQQTQSYTKLPSSVENGHEVDGLQVLEQGERINRVPNRPEIPSIRRRGTACWTGATLEARQKKLHQAVDEKLTTSWFSLHIRKLVAPVYISEVVEQSIHPAFRFFDLSLENSCVSRADEACLRLWVKNSRMEHFVLLQELELSFPALSFLGRNLDNSRLPLSANSILLHFEDGIYTPSATLSSWHRSMSQASRKAWILAPSKSSSYTALSELANMDGCAQDAIATQLKLHNQIDALLLRKQHNLQALARHDQLKENQNTARRAVVQTQRHLKALKSKRDHALASLELRKDVMASGRTARAKDEVKLKNFRDAIRQLHLQTQGVFVQRKTGLKRICDDLAAIYPTEPVNNRPMQFSIRHVFLPNSVFDDTNRDEIAAALGYASRVVHMLSLYLQLPLPYPISPMCSTSTIEDSISMSITQRTFPLYPVRMSYKFEYAVFLLNKDIEFLMNKNNLCLVDIRHTLPNLKCLLCVLAARNSRISDSSDGAARTLAAMDAYSNNDRRGSEGSLRSGSSFDSKVAQYASQNESQPAQRSGREKSPSPHHVADRISTSTGRSPVYENLSLRQEAF